MSLTEIIVNIREKMEVAVEIATGAKGDKGDKGDQGDPGPQGPPGGEFPSGLIVMWSGLLSAIPSGWLLCDGNNDTPDLRKKFIKGTAPGVDPGATGGAATHDHDNHADLVHAGAAVGNHPALSHGGTAVANHTGLTHTVTQPAAHSYNVIDEGTGASVNVLTTPGTHSGTAVAAHGSAGTLTHSVTQPSNHGTQAHIVTQPSDHQISAHSVESNEPPYFALAFIMKT